MLDRSPQLRDPVPLGTLPDVAPGTFRRFALVSRRAHAEDLGTPAGDTLLVSSSWLLWQELAREGWACVHVESTLPTDDSENLARDIYLRCNDWIYLDGEDATVFRGVSLGRKAVREVSLLVLERERLVAALGELVRRYAPRELVVYDIRAETSLLDDAGRLGVAREVAESAGVALVDRLDPTGDADPYMPIHPYYGTSERRNDGRGVKACLRALALRAIVALSNLRRLARDRRPGVLILCTQLSSRALLARLDGRRAVPVIPIDWLPGKGDAGFVWRCLRAGLRIPGSDNAALPAADRAAVDRIVARFRSAWQAPAAEKEECRRRYIRAAILDSGRLHEIARECLAAERLLARDGIRAVFTDGLQNRTINTVIEIAKARGLATAASWHGPYVQNYGLDILGSDPRYDRVVDVCLTWGEVHEAWLAAIGSTAERERIGNLVLAPTPGRPPPAEPSPRRNALVLQYAVPHADIRWPQAGQYAYFVAAVRACRDAGYENVRLKLHPGPSKSEYYERIAAEFGIDCDIAAGGAFMDHVAWADVVIGPVHSGAMLEVMAAGKPYHPVLLAPHSVDTRYLDADILCRDEAEIAAALANGRVPDSRRTLERFASAESVEAPDRAAWAALERLAGAVPQGAS